MSKSKLFVLIAVSVILVLSLFGCGNETPSENETQPETTKTIITTNTTNPENSGENAQSTDSSDTEEEFTQGENDLEILTVPQDDIKGSENSEVSEGSEAEETVTEAVVEPTQATEPATTEVQKIELPFVPAH